MAFEDSVFIQNLKDFKTSLWQQNDATIAHRTILSGGCYALDHPEYMLLKEKVATEFRIPAMEVLVVGSAKLGFSIAPDKRFRRFTDTSDIDVAIASPLLFERIWTLSLEHYRRHSYSWDHAALYQHYLFQGWISPDMMSPGFKVRRDWWDFFQTLTSSGDFGPIKISGALYKSWDHLENYQQKSVSNCRKDELEEAE